MIIPTVAIHHPLDPEIRMVINASDFLNGEHVPWGESYPAEDGLRVAKGARGLWFVKRGAEAVSQGFPNEAEALSAKAGMQG